MQILRIKYDMLQFTLPNDYPSSPPKLFILTPNQRFQTNEELCFSFTDRYARSVFHQKHEEGWRPTLTIEDVSMAVRLR
jgi:ubiquitin-protein ligase